MGVYNGLVKEKVKFPDDMNYYKPQDLKSKESVTQKPKDDLRASQSSNPKQSDRGGVSNVKNSQSLPKGINYGNRKKRKTFDFSSYKIILFTYFCF